MSVWQRLRDRFTGRPTPEPHANGVAEPRQTAPVREDAECVLAIKSVDPKSAESVTSALRALRSARGTSDERSALHAVLRLTTEMRAPPELAVAAAELFMERGQPEQALGLVDGMVNPAALLIAADIHAERGELPLALTLVERVLARDIRFAGARERHERWLRSLGRPMRALGSLDQPTVLQAEPPQTSLRIVAEAGRGGAGTVYEALDDALGRKVALKVYHRPVEERDKLEREARLAVRLVGAGVVRVFDADPERGFIVMEWVGGGSLKGVLKRADPELLLPIEGWFEPLASAVARVHAAGIVHADLKPANVLFRSPNELVISDFGLAHSPGSSSSGGSVGYLSPERLIDSPLSFADDVYALGRILEDVVQAVAEPAPARWRSLAQSLTGDRSVRPPDAAAVLAMLEG